MPKRYKDIAPQYQHSNGWSGLLTRTKFWTIFALLSLFTFIPFGFYVTNQNDKLEESYVEASKIALNTKIASVNQLFTNMGGALNVMSNLPDLVSALDTGQAIKPDTVEFLSELLLTFKRFDQIAILNANGGYHFLEYKELGQGVVVPKAELGQFPQQDFFETVRAGRDNYAYVSSFVFERKASVNGNITPSFYMSMPIFNDSGNFIGAIALKIATDMRYQRIANDATPFASIKHMDIFNGDWFSNDLNPSLALLGGREMTGRNVENDDPTLWREFSTHKMGTYSNSDGIYTYAAIMPLALDRSTDGIWRFDPSQLGNYQYIFVNLTRWEDIYSNAPFETQLAIGLMLLIIVVFVSFVAATRSENTQFIREKSQQLEDLFQLNDAIIDNLGAALIGINQQGIITRFSRHAETLFGYQAEDVEGSNVKILMRADIAAKHDSYLSDYIKDTQAGMSKVQSILGQTRVLIAKAKDGKEFPVEIVVTKVPFGNTYRFVGLITDISERLSLQDEITEALKNAKEASEHKSAFLARMSHEIRTPMNGIYGTLQLLRSRLRHSEHHDLIEKSIYSCKTLLTIINDILDISKIEANKIDLEEVPFNFIGIVNEVVSDIKDLAEQKGLTIDIEGMNNFHDGWLGDPTRIKQILLNLCSNALKFTNQGKIVINFSNANASGLIFQVQDTGIGMNPEQAARIFTPFEQADKSITRRFGGTGLGMSICYELSRLMEGSISVQSEEGEGTTFTVKLPLKHIAVTPDQDHTYSEVPDLTGHKILLVEDNVVNQTVFEAMLNDTMAELQIANDGLEALDILRNFEPELIFMDIQMPNMDGMECCKKIKADDPLIPVVALTANVMTSDLREYRKKGFDDFMPKPFEISKLYSLLNKYLDTRKLRKRRS